MQYMETFALTPSSDLDSKRDKIKENKDMYFMNTHFLNDYNELYNTNVHLEQKADLENERLQNVYDRIRSTSLKMKQELLLKKYAVTDFSVKSNILYTAIVLTSFMLIMMVSYSKDQVGKNFLSTIIGVTSVVFILIVFVIVKANSYRVETNWNKYYWGPLKTN
jgi:hypothetical protein